MRASIKHAYFPHVDGLRAIAVLAVVFYHLHSAWVPGGFAGVDIFFVISGFIVSASVSTLKRSPIWNFLPFFYARRIQRIAPALIVCLLTTNFIAALLIPMSWLSSTNQQTSIYAFFGLSNLILARTNNDYFSPVGEFNPYMHTWSLSIEEQFYFAFPLMFFAWTFAGKWRNFTVALFATTLVASLGYSAWMGNTDKITAFYMITSRFWQLAVGVLLFQTMNLLGRRFDVADQTSPRWYTCGAMASIALIAYSFAASRPDRLPFPGALPAVVGATGLLFFLHGKSHTNPVMWALGSRSILFIGRISYSLYLWHWPIFVMFRWTIGLDRDSYRLAALAIALVLSALSYYFVEKPFRNLKFLSSMARPAVVMIGFAFIGMCAWFGMLVNEAQPRISLSTVTRHANDWYPYGADTDPAYAGCTIGTENTPLGMSFSTTFTRQNCTSEAEAPRVYAIGDSHSMAYVGMYKEYVMRTGSSLTSYVNGGCPFISLQPGREASELCRANSSAAVNDMLGRLKPGDVVFLPSLRMPRFVDQYFIFPEKETMDQIFGNSAIKARAEAIIEGKKVLERLSEKGAVVVIEAPKPLFKAPLYRCAESYNRSLPICRPGTEMKRSALLELRKPIIDSLQRLAAAVPNTLVWDPFPLLCPPALQCSGYSSGHPLFFDSDHISGYGARLVYPAFEAFIKNASNAATQ
ncbi:acyltransferase family protein [Paraburkholderia caffeinilytica]|uniref:acyltransferase family protein n=1 Tax=Paraburkholderia caffeinilytica TaxID=1761016 RepID=UPI003DA14D1C